MATIQSTLALGDKMSPALNSIVKAMQSTLAAARAIQGAELGQTYADAAADVKLAELAVERMNDALRETPGAAQGAGDAMTALEYMSTRALGWIAGKAKQAAGEIVGLTDSLTASSARIGLIAGPGESVAGIQQDIYEAAQRSRGVYLGMTDTVAQLSMLTEGVFNNTAETTRFVELLNKQFVIAGTNASGIESTMYNLTQAMSLGVLQGQDLRAVLQNAAPVVQNIAEYMGVTVGEVRALAAEGAITADIVKNALFSAADEINAKFGEMPMTLGQIWTAVGNAATEALSPALEALGRAASWVYENWDAAQYIVIPVALGIAAVLGSVLVPAIWAAITSFLALDKATLVLAGKWAAVGIAVGLIIALWNSAAGKGRTLATVVGGLSVAVGIATIAWVAFNAAVGATPIGWILGGIGLIVGGLVFLGKALFGVEEQVSETTGALTEYESALAGTTAAMDAAAGAGMSWSDAMGGAAGDAYTAGIQARKLAQMMDNAAKSESLNTAELKRMSIMYNQMLTLVPNLTEQLGRQDAKTAELLGSLQDLEGVRFDAVTASLLGQQDAVIGLTGSVLAASEAYLQFAKAQAIAAAYQVKANEVARSYANAEATREELVRKISELPDSARVMYDANTGMTSADYYAAKAAPGERAAEWATSVAGEKTWMIKGLQTMAPTLASPSWTSDYNQLRAEMFAQDAAMSAADTELERLLKMGTSYLGDSLDLWKGSTSGGSVNTRVTEPVKFATDDLQMLMDLATREFQVNYQVLEPQIVLDGMVIHEDVDVDDVLERIGEAVEEFAGVRLI